MVANFLQCIENLSTDAFWGIQPPGQSLDKCFVALLSFGLCSWCIGVWQRRIGGEPKAYEQSQRLVADFHASI